MKKNILLTEMKLINLVKQIINEDNLMSSFLSDNKPDRSSDGVAKMRYFNTYEEAFLASQIAEAEGNKVSSSETNPAGAFVRTSFKYKPKGTATNLLFKKK